MPDDAIPTATAGSEGSLADRTLVIERVFKAPPEEVFKAWTDPAILVKWWGPEGFAAPDVAMDVREGGAWRTSMSGPGGAHVVSGVYREIAPPHRLVTTWGWEREDGSRGHETVVEVTLEPAPEGTRLRLVQSLFLSAGQRDSHNMGWPSSFNDLDRVFA
jgi:uncharacterized protein YndB with AHSA1/START domain